MESETNKECSNIYRNTWRNQYKLFASNLCCWGGAGRVEVQVNGRDPKYVAVTVSFPSHQGILPRSVQMWSVPGYPLPARPPPWAWLLWNTDHLVPRDPEDSVAFAALKQLSAKCGNENLEQFWDWVAGRIAHKRIRGSTKSLSRIAPSKAKENSLTHSLKCHHVCCSPEAYSLTASDFWGLQLENSQVHRIFIGDW